MADITSDAAAATAVVREFVRYTVETLDKEKAKTFLTKSCREAEQFNPTEMKGRRSTLVRRRSKGMGRRAR
jgi:hypothetical protein